MTNENIKLSLKITNKGHVYDDWSDRLKPCPRCGKDAFMFFNSLAHGNRYYIGCTDGDCKMQLQPYHFKTPDEAAEHWNTRAERTCHEEMGEIPTDLLSFIEARRDGYEILKTEGWRCSECHMPTSGKYFQFENGKLTETSSPWFCPSCGAKVVGDAE